MPIGDSDSATESGSKSMLTSVMNRITGHSSSSGSSVDQAADGKTAASPEQNGSGRQSNGQKGPAAQLQASLPPVATRYAPSAYVYQNDN